MAFPKMSDIENLSDEEVNEQILSLKRELFTLRLQKSYAPVGKNPPVQAQETPTVSVAHTGRRTQTG